MSVFQNYANKVIKGELFHHSFQHKFVRLTIIFTQPNNFTAIKIREIPKPQTL